MDVRKKTNKQRGRKNVGRERRDHRRASELETHLGGRLHRPGLGLCHERNRGRKAKREAPAILKRERA